MKIEHINVWGFRGGPFIGGALAVLTFLLLYAADNTPLNLLISIPATTLILGAIVYLYQRELNEAADLFEMMSEIIELQHNIVETLASCRDKHIELKDE